MDSDRVEARDLGRLLNSVCKTFHCLLLRMLALQEHLHNQDIASGYKSLGVTTAPRPRTFLQNPAKRARLFFLFSNEFVP